MHEISNKSESSKVGFSQDVRAFSDSAIFKITVFKVAVCQSNRLCSCPNPDGKFIIFAADDYAKDGGMEVIIKMHCVPDANSIQ